MVGTTNVGRERRPRGSIDPDMILKGAFEVAESVGLDNLSMPYLATHLDVGVTSIYWHFRNKEDLLRQMTSRALQHVRKEMRSIENWAPEEWRDYLEDRFTQLYRIHRSSNVITDITLLRGKTFSSDTTRQSFGRLEENLDFLVRAGFPLTTAWQVYTTCSVYTRGMVISEAMQRTNQAPPTENGEQLRLLQVDQMPLLHELLVEEGISIDMMNERNFLAGLHMVLDSAERILAETTTVNSAEGDARTNSP